MMRPFIAFIPWLVIGCTSAGEDGGDEDIARGLMCSPGCRDDACSVFGTCVDPDQLRSVQVTWTAWGDPADEYGCGARDAFDFTLTRLADSVAWNGVACVAGSLRIDRVPGGLVQLVVDDATSFPVPRDGHVWFDLTELP